MGIFKHLFWAVPVLAFILYYITVQNEEVKQSMTVKESKEDIRVDQFLADFAREDENFASNKSEKAFYANKAESYEAKVKEKEDEIKIKKERETRLKAKSEEIMNEMEKEAKSFKFDEKSHRKDFEDL